MIDAHIEWPWPDELLHALERFKQGDLVERPPFAYFAVPQYGIWGLTKEAGNPVAQTDLLELDPRDPQAPPYGIITTQTCDINEQSPKPRQPWIHVVPVYNRDDLNQEARGTVSRSRVLHLMHLTGVDLPPGFWVADLRIQIPVEESYLVGRQPIEGFATEREYIRFGRHLAKRYVRPALDNTISVHIVQELRKTLGKLSRSKRKELLDPIEYLRLLVSPSRLQARAARLVIVMQTGQPTDHIRRWFDQWWDGAQPRCREAGIDLLHNQYASMDSLSAADFDNSIELDFEYLSPED